MLFSALPAPASVHILERHVDKMVAKAKSSSHSHPMVKKGRKPSTTSKRGGGGARAPFKKMAKKSTVERGEKKSPMRKSAPRRAGAGAAHHKSAAGARKKHAPSLMGSAGVPGAAPATLGGATPVQGSPMQKKAVKRSVGGAGEGKSPAKRTMRKKAGAGGTKKTGRKAVKKQ